MSSLKELVGSKYQNHNLEYATQAPVDFTHKHWKYDTNGLLVVPAGNILGLPFTLKINGHDNTIDFSIQPNNQENAQRLSYATVNYHELQACYSQMTIDQPSNTIALGKLLTQHQFDPTTSPHISYGNNTCLIVKEMLPGSNIGPDILRLNLGPKDAESVEIERIGILTKGDAADVTLLTARGNQIVSISPEEALPQINPRSNRIILKGFHPNPEIMENGLIGPASHQIVHKPKLELFRDGNKQLSLKASGYTDSTSQHLSPRLHGVLDEAMFDCGETVDLQRLDPSAIHHLILMINTGLYNIALGKFSLSQSSEHWWLRYEEVTELGKREGGNIVYENRLIYSSTQQNTSITTPSEKYSNLKALAERYNIQPALHRAQKPVEKSTSYIRRG